MKYEIKNSTEAETLFQDISKKLEGSKKGLSVEVKNATRTTVQNSALHSTLTQLANELNEAGYEYKILLEGAKNHIIMPYTKNTLKKLFKFFVKSMYGHDSTTKLTTVEIQEAYKVFSNRFAELSGINVEWHSNRR